MIPTASASTEPPRPTLAECIVGTAVAEIGTKEATGNNDGPRIAEYIGSCDITWEVPWCACFQHWVFRQCGRVVKPEMDYALSGRWHPEARWVYAKAWKTDTIPVLSADLFSLYYAELQRIGHTGIIERVEGEHLITIEGNTGSGGEREGQGVWRRKRLKRSVYSISRWIDN